jgi:hypothetical protein
MFFMNGTLFVTNLERIYGRKINPLQRTHKVTGRKNELTFFKWVEFHQIFIHKFEKIQPESNKIVQKS